MTTVYDIGTYLLDRANIQDTVTRMALSYDTQDTATLVDLVYAPRIHLEYDPRLLSQCIMNVSSQEWAARLEHLHDNYDTTQHIVQNILMDLPQPVAGRAPPRPERCKVVAYAHGLFYKNDGEGYPRVMGRRQGARWELELMRLRSAEGRGENPWRIDKQKVTLDWQEKGAE